MNNPYPRLTGFSKRVTYAECRLCGLAQDPQCNIFTRTFDNCFEEGDGDAVVFALMEKASWKPQLFEGVQQLNRGEVPQRWLDVFQSQSGQMNLLERLF